MKVSSFKSLQLLLSASAHYTLSITKSRQDSFNVHWYSTLMLYCITRWTTCSIRALPRCNMKWHCNFRVYQRRAFIYALESTPVYHKSSVRKPLILRSQLSFPNLHITLLNYIIFWTEVQKRLSTNDSFWPLSSSQTKDKRCTVENKGVRALNNNVSGISLNMQWQKQVNEETPTILI